MTNSFTNVNIKSGTCVTCRCPFSVKGCWKRNAKPQTHAAQKVICKERINKPRRPQKGAFISESKVLQAQVYEKTLPLSKRSDELNTTKKKMAIDALLNPFVEQNLQNVRQAVPTADAPLQEFPTATDPPASDNILASFSESSENLQRNLSREGIAALLVTYIQNPLADVISPQIKNSYQHVSLPTLPEEWNDQPANQNVASKDMEIEELMCSEDELDGVSDSETTLTAPLDEDDLHSLLDDIVSMDEVLHVLDLYDPEGFDTTSGIFPAQLEDYPMKWNVDG